MLEHLKYERPYFGVVVIARTISSFIAGDTIAILCAHMQKVGPLKDEA